MSIETIPGNNMFLSRISNNDIYVYRLWMALLPIILLNVPNGHAIFITYAE
jgi:hypothetical protein